MNSVFENDPAALYELSKRVDHAETDIRMLRERSHKAENNIASSSALLAQTTMSLNWVIDTLEKISGKIDKSEADNLKKREEELKEIIKEKSGSLRKIKEFLMSEKFVLYIIAILYIADKLSFAEHIDKVRGLTGG